MARTLRWWQKTTIYHIYLRSFLDTNQDGIGDLPGVIARLDYIKELGFETIWLTSFFRSPQRDWGYDISDYYSVAPEYGDLTDIETLIDEVHNKGMRILFDFVLNHTSDQHPWFQESRQRRDHPRRDWYIWQDGRGKRPPNNWPAITGGSGWNYDQTTDQWYYASFFPFQPDLNYRNPAVKEAMFDVARYWLDKGIDGLRLDIFHAVFKDERFRDNPFSWHYVPKDHQAGYFQQWKYNLNRPETFRLARALRAVVDSYTPDRLLLGELFGNDETLKNYLGDQRDGLHLIFLWALTKPKLKASFFRDVIRRYEGYYPPPYTPVYVFGNHDQKRSISKIGNAPRLAKLLALFQFTVRGVPVTYYGEEIGLEESSLPARTAKDPLGRRYGWVPDFLVDLLGLYVNRDGCRTPMQWDDSANAGFCNQDVNPWLPVHPNYRSTNVKKQQASEDSILNIYRRLLRLRRSSLALEEGTLELIAGPEIDENLLAYCRKSGKEIALILINFGPRPSSFRNRTGCKQVLFQTGLDEPVNPDIISLAPYSGVILG